MPFTPVAGTDGRLKLGAATVAGITSWKRQSSTGVIRLPHFESPADATTGVVQPNKLKGLGDNKVMIEGIVDTTAADQLANGVSVTLDLVVSKGSSKGYDGVAGFVSSFELGTKVADEASTFTATVDVDGVFPAFGTIS